MGCGSSLAFIGNKTLPVGKVSPRSINGVLTDVNEQKKDDVSLPLTVGYLDDDNSCPVESYADYSGYVTTFAGGTSKKRADVVCMWLDCALSTLDKEGGVFFDPENLNVWPIDLLVK
ncbi:unnamed protein product [Phytomonas sp. Hart1]|nr:unnamed protein product [Phytomonas sp. Hart1]|eukprot:CCW68973.1 unnamed protein product [Phytomonas sp. isolate Hart1]